MALKCTLSATARIGKATPKTTHRRRKGSVVGGTMASAEPPAGFRGRAPGQGVRGAKPPEAESILVIGCPTKPANLAPVRENSILCYGPLVSELGGGQSAWCPPTPSLGGLCHRLRRL